MELFYNPERMSETEIKETFVAHQWLVDEIIGILKRQPKGAGVQHVVIVAPRGMGKTTLLLMLRLTVLNQDIVKSWQPVLFPEESYSVYDLADLWLEVLDHIASETGNVVLHNEVEKLKATHPNSSDLEAIALANIKDWREKKKKRLLLLVDNFDMILDQIGDEKDNASLRDVLMNDGTMMLVGGSTTFFKEARAYNQPLYNLFKIYNLNGLDSDQIEELLRRRAKIDGLENFEETLRANRSRLRVLEYFTGGNPRLALMLYRVITHSEISEVRRGLEKLLDEVTPYYKAKIETLPAQQRKILDQIARISAQTREGLTPTEIASATRLAVNQVSSQLKRLADVGYVHAANIRGRSSYYTLSEPLYAIWHQMRFGRDARTKMHWLVGFLKVWYDAKELGIECRRLQNAFRNHLSAGREKDARDALEHRRYLMEAIEDPRSRKRTFESIILGYLELSDMTTLKDEILTDIDLRSLSDGTRGRLFEAGLLTHNGVSLDDGAKDTERLNLAFRRVRTAIKEENYLQVAEILQELEDGFPGSSPQLLMLRALIDFFSQKTASCLANLKKLLREMPNLSLAWALKGYVLKQASRLEEAVVAFKRSIELGPDCEDAFMLADTLEDLGRNDEALFYFDLALQIKPDFFWAILGRAHLLDALGRTDEAQSTFDHAISLKPNSAEEWYERARLLASREEIDEAVKSFDRSIKLKPKSYDFMYGKCWALGRQERLPEALECVNKMLQLEPESADAFFLRAVYTSASDFDAARTDLNYAFSLKSSSHRNLVDGLQGRSLKVMFSMIARELDDVKRDWKELMDYISQQGDQSGWLEGVSALVTFIAESGEWVLAKELINSAGLEQPLFPLSRALDYLIRRDEAIIEKLSPEIRTIVNEIVMTFKKGSDERENVNNDVKGGGSVRKSKSKGKTSKSSKDRLSKTL